MVYRSHYDFTWGMHGHLVFELIKLCRFLSNITWKRGLSMSLSSHLHTSDMLLCLVMLKMYSLIFSFPLMKTVYSKYRYLAFSNIYWYLIISPLVISTPFLIYWLNNCETFYCYNRNSYIYKLSSLFWNIYTCMVYYQWGFCPYTGCICITHVSSFVFISFSLLKRQFSAKDFFMCKCVIQSCTVYQILDTSTERPTTSILNGWRLLKFHWLNTLIADQPISQIWLGLFICSHDQQIHVFYH